MPELPDDPRGWPANPFELLGVPAGAPGADREAEAYSGLAELARARPDRADVPVRLYWLLALDPQLDPRRTRHDWLALALARSGLRGPAAELYRRELAADPHRALADPYA